MIEKIKLKTRYHFKQAKIPVDHMSREDIQNEIKEKVTPAVLELEAKELIDGFYFIANEKLLKLRLSSNCWIEKKQAIQDVLRANGFSGELDDTTGLHDNDFDALNDNNMEFNSRLVIGYLMLKDEDKTKEQDKFIENLPEQWLHYLYNQFGYAYFDEAKHHFGSGFFYLRRALGHEQCNLPKYIKELEKVKAIAQKEIDDLGQGQD